MVWEKIFSVEPVIDVSDAPGEDADPCFPGKVPEVVSVVDSNSSNLCEVFRWKPITLDWIHSPADELLEALRYLFSVCAS